MENGDKEFKMSGGEQVRDFLSVEEVVTNIRKIAMINSNLGIINCSSGKPQTVKSFVENYLLNRKSNLKLILGYYPYPNYEQMEFWGDASKLKSIIESTEVKALS